MINYEFFFLAILYSRICNYSVTYVERLNIQFHKYGIKTALVADPSMMCKIKIALYKMGPSVLIDNIEYSQIFVTKNNFTVCLPSIRYCQDYVFKNYKLRTNLKGANVKVSAMEQFQIKYILETEMQGNVKVFSNAGFVSRLLLLIQKRLNIRYQIMETTSSNFDLLPLISIRKEGLEYCPIITFQNVVFVIRSAQKMDNAYAYVKPFHYLLWKCTLLAVLLGTIMLYGIGRCEHKITKRCAPSLNQLFWTLITTSLRQDLSFDKFPGSSTRLAVITWTISMFVLTASYSGAILSFITLPGSHPIPETFSELKDAVEKGEYSAGMKEISFFRYFMLLYATKEQVRFLELTAVNNTVQSIEEGIQRVMKEKYAYIDLDLHLKPYLMEHEEEKFAISRDSYFSTYATCAFSPSFSYRKEFVRIIRKLYESGIINKFYNDELEQVRRLTFYSTDDIIVQHALSVNDIVPALYVLLSGYGLSMLTCLIEIIAYHVHKRLRHISYW